MQRTQSCVFDFSGKSPKVSERKVEYVRCAACVITRGASCIRVFR